MEKYPSNNYCIYVFYQVRFTNNHEDEHFYVIYESAQKKMLEKVLLFAKKI